MSLAGSNPALSAIDDNKQQTADSKPGSRFCCWLFAVCRHVGRGARVADWARLEIVCARKRTVGSNPTLSAIVRFQRLGASF